MWLKIFSAIAILLQIIFQILQSMAQKKIKDEASAEITQGNEQIIEEEVNEANIIRVGGDLSDDLLLKPEQRSSGGMPGVSADLRGLGIGGQGIGPTPDSGKNQGA